MSIVSPHHDTPTCLLLLPFLLPPRARLFLRELAKQSTVRKQAWASKTVARSLCSRRLPGPAQNNGPVLSTGWQRKSEFSRCKAGLGSEKQWKCYSSLAGKAAEIDIESMIWETPSSPEIEEALIDGPSRPYDDQFWGLLKLSPTSDERTPEHISQLPSFQRKLVCSTYQTRRLRGIQHRSNHDHTYIDYDQIYRDTPLLKAEPGGDDIIWNSVSFRTARLEEGIRPPPRFSSPEDRRDYFSLYVEKFLPPHLQQGNTTPSPPISSKIQDTEASWLVDMPIPSVFGNFRAGIMAEDQSKPDKSEQLKALEAEWDEKWEFKSYLKLLHTLEFSRDQGVDVLNTLLLKRRQREVIWIAKRLVDRGPTNFGSDLPVWEGTSARGDDDDHRKPSVGDIVFYSLQERSREETGDIIRRRRGVGVLLTSLTSMLLSGWRAENTSKQGFFNVMTMIDTPPVIEGDGDPFPLSGIDSLVSSLIPRYGQGTEEEDARAELTPDEIFSTVAQLLAYLHVEGHVPSIVYSAKHPQLLHRQSDIMKVISAEVELAYGRELGLNIPQPDRPSGKIDWGLWLELVNCIAAERGLGISSTWLILQGHPHILWHQDSHQSTSNHKLGHKLAKVTSGSEQDSTSAPKLPSSRAFLDKKISLPSYLIEQAVATCFLNTASDAWPPSTPMRMLETLEQISRSTGPLRLSFMREIFNHHEFNDKAAYARKLLDIDVKPSWDLGTRYQILNGHIYRSDMATFVEQWANIEEMIIGESSVPSDYRIEKSVPRFADTFFAPKQAFQHPIYITARVLRLLRSGKRWRLIRHMIQTTIPFPLPKTRSILYQPAVVNPLFTYAGVVGDVNLARKLLSLIAPPLPNTTLTTIMNMHLALGQNREAQAVLDFMHRSKIDADVIDLGIITFTNFGKGHEDGYNFVDKLVMQADAVLERQKEAMLKVDDPETSQNFSSPRIDEDGTVVKTWQKNVTPPLKNQPKKDIIGDASWRAVLVAAVKDNNKERAQQALNRMGLDINSLSSGSKMAITVFNTLLMGVCRSSGSRKAMDMTKLYCVPDRQLLRRKDASLKSHRQGDRRLDELAGPDGRDVVTMQKVDLEPMLNLSSKDREIAQDLEGAIVPDVITFRTLIHQAMRERRDYFRTQHYFNRKAHGVPVAPEETQWVEKYGYDKKDWVNVLDWTKAMWLMMEWGPAEYERLIRQRLRGSRDRPSGPSRRPKRGPVERNEATGESTEVMYPNKKSGSKKQFGVFDLRDKPRKIDKWRKLRGEPVPPVFGDEVESGPRLFSDDVESGTK